MIKRISLPRIVKRIILIGIAIISYLILFLYEPVKLCFVEGNSMQPTLNSGAICLLININISSVKVGAIVAAKHENIILIKRVVATHENQTVLFSPPENHVAVLGDNIGNSIDSLTWENPYIHISDIKGKIIMVLYKGSGHN